MAAVPEVHAQSPLVASPPTEVPLKNAPLVRVLAQLRFPLIVAVDQRAFVAPFQEAVRAAYPVLRQEQTRGFAFTSAGLVPAPSETVWRFSDVTGAWRISLAPEFIALETRAYVSRADFLSRFRAVVEALEEHIGPKLVDRLGVRYVDRIPATEDIAKLVRPEILGVAGTSLAGHVQHSVSETLFELDGARLLGRWGCLPPNATIDPAALEPSAEASWILDLDMFTAEPRPFDVEKVLGDAREFTERIYSVFRWAVTSEFLRKYGGEV